MHAKLENNFIEEKYYNTYYSIQIYLDILSDSVDVYYTNIMVTILFCFVLFLFLVLFFWCLKHCIIMIII